MSLPNVIGPKELYVCPVDFREVQSFLAKDDISSVTWLQNYMVKEKKEYYNGHDKLFNILMQAAAKSNVALVKYIVEHIKDPRVLEMKDTYGKTALFHAALGSGPCEKVRECVKILLDHGANPHVRPSKKITPSQLEVEIQPDYYGSNLAGTMLEQVAAADVEGSFDWKQNAQAQVLELLLAHKATCYIDSLGEIDISTTSDDTFPEIQALVHRRVRLLKTGYDHLFWSKTRFLNLAEKSPESPFAQLPTDLNYLIYQTLLDEIN